MGRLDEAGRLGIVGKRVADLSNGHLEDGIADKGILPDGADQVLLGNELARTPQQVFEHGERLGPELDRLRTPPQALVCQVERKRIEFDATVVHTGITTT